MMEVVNNDKELWCKCLLEQFEKLKLDETSTTESEEEAKHRESLLKEILVQELKNTPGSGNIDMEDDDKMKLMKQEALQR